MQGIPRREFMTTGAATLAGLAAFFASRHAYAFPADPARKSSNGSISCRRTRFRRSSRTNSFGRTSIPGSRRTTSFFQSRISIGRSSTKSTWKLEIGGLVKKPMTLTLADIKARPRQEVTFTIECSGNHGFPFFNGGIGNARWAGTPLAPILKEAGVLDSGIEVVFWGTDEGEITDDIRDVKFKQNFARSMSLADAMDPKNILCYEMNGAPLPRRQRLPAAADRAGLVRHRQREMAQAHRGARPALREPVSWDATTSPSARKTTTARRCGWRPRSDGRGSSRRRPGSPTSATTIGSSEPPGVRRSTGSR